MSCLKIKISATGERLPVVATEFAAVLNTETNRMAAPSSLFPDRLDHAGAVAAIAALNASNYAGHNDWRLGKRWEHLGDIDRSFDDPQVDPAFYPNTPSNWHWTEESVPEAWSSDSVLFVDFYSGYVYDNNRYSKAFVRAVRSVAPAGQ